MLIELLHPWVQPALNLHFLLRALNGMNKCNCRSFAVNNSSSMIDCADRGSINKKIDAFAVFDLDQGSFADYCA
jgi:hypothetical protein